VDNRTRAETNASAGHIPHPGPRRVGVFRTFAPTFICRLGVGCDYQFAGNWVVGVQAMADAGNLRSSHVVPTAFPGFPVGAFISNNRVNYTVDFQRKNIAFIAGPATVGAPDIVSTRLTIQQALVGVNYKFNWGGPVVAKY
jgi:hypothetical protein